MKTVPRANVLSLGVTAVLALAVGVPAFASAHVYIAKSTPIVAKGSESTFALGEALMTCKKAEFTYSGPVGNKFATIEMTPAYKECSVLGNTAVFTVEKAHYEFGALTEVTSSEFKMPAAIVGEAGAQLKIKVTFSGEKCEITIPAQKLSGEEMRIVNSLGGEGAEIHAKFSGAEYKSNGKCAGFVKTSGKDGAYEGTAGEKGLIAE